MKVLKALPYIFLFWSLTALAATPATSEWVLTDLTTIPDLSMFFGHADAVITTKPDPQSDAVRPTVFAFKLQDKPKGRLKASHEWLAFLKTSIKNGKRVILNQDPTQSGRYILEFTSRNIDSHTDLHSLYLAIQNEDDSVSLFVYDGVGPSTSRHLPVVRAFFNELDQHRLMDLYKADLQRRKDLKPGQPY